MKFTLYLIAVAILGILFACLLPMLTKHDNRKFRSGGRYRMRPFSLLERFMLPFVMAMESLSTWLHRNFTWHGGNRLALGNYLATMPGPNDTKLADEAIGRFHLVKFGTDADHVGLCDKNDIPLGFTRDSSASAAEESLAFELFGLSHKASQATSSGAITGGHLVCPGDNGTLRDVTLVAGETVYVCGQALTSVADGKTFTFVPYPPTKLVIA
jgi:hypothetical protein